MHTGHGDATTIGAEAPGIPERPDRGEAMALDFTQHEAIALASERQRRAGHDVRVVAWPGCDVDAAPVSTLTPEPESRR